MSIHQARLVRVGCMSVRILSIPFAWATITGLFKTGLAVERPDFVRKASGPDRAKPDADGCLIQFVKTRFGMWIFEGAIEEIPARWHGSCAKDIQLSSHDWSHK